MHRQLAIGVVRSDDDGAPAATSSPPFDDEPSLFITRLFSSETQYMTDPDYVTRRQTRPVYRQDAINSILKVHDHFQFRPETAFLSINYLDRFLFSHTIPEIGWAFQLVSVACLSLAAKMVEVNVPLLLDLQTVDQSYVFEPKTVQRMELLVTTSLQWRLHSVTPFGYLKHFISNISDCEIGDDELQSLSSSIILNTTRVIDFLKFPPSVIAASAVISAAGVEVAVSDTFDERLNKSMVRSCHQLMEEYLLDTCPFVKAEPAIQVVDHRVTPPSPVGVLDTAACVSCDTHSENHVSGAGNKRLRLSETSVQEP